MRKLAAFLTIYLGIYAAAAWGQGTTALRGSVTDSSGSAILGALVTLTNTDTNVARSTTSSTGGGYAFVELSPGTYALTVDAKGFRKYEQSGVVLRVDLPATVNIRMQVGTTSEVVT